MADPIRCNHDGCVETATVDMNFWPPATVEREREIHYRCPDGHKFIHRVRVN